MKTKKVPRGDLPVVSFRVELRIKRHLRRAAVECDESLAEFVEKAALERANRKLGRGPDA